APTPLASPTAAAPAPSPAPALAQQSPAAPAEPWYRRWFSWLPWNSAKKTTEPPVSQPQGSALSAQAEAAPAPSARGQYAYDASNRGIRAGVTGQCVRMGTTNLEVPSGDCQAQLIAAQTPSGAAASPGPVAVAAAPKLPPPTAVAMAEPANQRGAGSAPAPMLSQARPPEPVYVVPLPPAPPAAKEERALEPVEPASMRHDETIAALSETPMMP